MFVADDSKSIPVVYMYKFFEVWSKCKFSLQKFERFYFSYMKFISEIENELGIRVKDLTRKTHNENEANMKYLKFKSEEIMATFKSNDLFKYICKDLYEDYLKNPNVTNIKKCFQENTVYGVLSAYRLFYVGCSRARKNLTVLLKKSEINDFKEELIKKAKLTIRR